MMRIIHRASFALVAVTLVLSLLAAPAAWAGPITPQGSTTWLGQLWGWVSSWVIPADSAATTDSSANEETSTSTETWDPTPLDPSSTSAVEDDDEDRGPAMDPNG